MIGYYGCFGIGAVLYTMAIIYLMAFVKEPKKKKKGGNEKPEVSIVAYSASGQEIQGG